MTGPSQSTRDRVLGCHKDLSLFQRSDSDEW